MLKPILDPVGSFDASNSFSFSYYWPLTAAAKSELIIEYLENNKIVYEATKTVVNATHTYTSSGLLVNGNMARAKIKLLDSGDNPISEFSNWIIFKTIPQPTYDTFVYQHLGDNHVLSIDFVRDAQDIVEYHYANIYDGIGTLITQTEVIYGASLISQQISEYTTDLSDGNYSVEFVTKILRGTEYTSSLYPFVVSNLSFAYTGVFEMVVQNGYVNIFLNDISNEITTPYILFQKRELGGKWTNIAVILKNTIYPLKDYIVAAHKSYEYAFAPFDTSKPYEKFEYPILINTDFQGSFLFDLNESYHLLYNTTISNRVISTDISKFDLYESLHPLVVFGVKKYYTFSIETLVIANEILDITDQQIYRNNFITFLKNSKPKLFKSHNGDIMIIMIKDDIKESPYSGISGLSNLAFSLVQIDRLSNEKLVKYQLIPGWELL